MKNKLNKPYKSTLDIRKPEGTERFRKEAVKPVTHTHKEKVNKEVVDMSLRPAWST